MIELSDGGIGLRGDVWRANFIYTNPIDGKTKRIFRNLKAKTKTEAKLEKNAIRNTVAMELEARYAEELAEREASDKDDAPEGYGSKAEFSAEMTLGEYLAKYYAIREATGAVDTATLKKNKGDTKRMGALVEVRVEDITRDMVDELLINLTEKGYAKVTIRSVLVHLKQVLAHAKERDLINKNPVDGAFIPKVPPRVIKFLTNTQRNEYLEFLNASERNYLIIASYLGLFTGMRIGEVCGLKWSCVNLDSDEVYVRKVITEDTDGKERLKPIPKGKEFRTIPLPTPLKNILRDWKKQYPQDCDGHFVIGPIDNQDKWQSKGMLGKEYSSLMKTLGYNITFHDLRHTFATYMVANGINVVTLSAILGHKDIETTLKYYAGVDPDAHNAAKALMDRIDSAYAEEVDWLNYEEDIVAKINQIAKHFSGAGGNEEFADRVFDNRTKELYSEIIEVVPAEDENEMKSAFLHLRQNAIELLAMVAVLQRVVRE